MLFLRISSWRFRQRMIEVVWIISGTWRKGAEMGLFRAYCRAAGPVAPGRHAFLGRSRLRIRRRRLGGWGCWEKRCYQVVQG